jgi:hypothetical protein
VLKNQHLKLRVAQGRVCLDALAWNWGEQASQWMQGQIVDGAFTLTENTFQEISTLQLELKDLRLAEV